MKISLISDADVLDCVGKIRNGEPTYYIRNILSYKYRNLDTASVLRKLNDMEKRGLVKRTKNPYLLNSISWTSV